MSCGYAGIVEEKHSSKHASQHIEEELLDDPKVARWQKQLMLKAKQAVKRDATHMEGTMSVEAQIDAWEERRGKLRRGAINGVRLRTHYSGFDNFSKVLITDGHPTPAGSVGHSP